MAATRDEIRSWIETGKTEGATHVIVVCDTIKDQDYPVYVMPGQNTREKRDEYDGKTMQKVTEVFELSIDIEAQLRGIVTARL